MATSPCLYLAGYCFITTKNQGSCSINSRSQNTLRGEKSCSFKVKASNNEPSTKRNSVNEPSTKRNSVLCADCDGNGAVCCSQCKGSGVNSTDHFNGKFKAGESCWLCGGKKDILCGNCQGAGFIGGFMTSSDT